MNQSEKELYQRLQAFSLDEPNAESPLSQRLVEENNWSPKYAALVINEYKKFAFLAVAANHAVTPSKAIDRVWHLHLIYTRSYWEEFCPHILQKPFHHNPSLGGDLETKKYQTCYLETLKSYEKFFQCKPPENIWGKLDTETPKNLFKEKQNNNDSSIKFNTGQTIWAICGLFFIIVALISQPDLEFNFYNPLDWQGAVFILFYIGLGILDLILAFWLRQFISKHNGLTSENCSLARWSSATVIFLLFFLGISKICVGILRGKPIGFLLILSLLTGWIGFNFLSKENIFSLNYNRYIDDSTSSRGWFGRCGSDSDGGSCGSGDGCGGCGGCGG